MSIGSDYLRAGMSSSAVETQETRAQSVKVTGEALTVDLVDGRTIIVPLVWFPRLWQVQSGTDSISVHENNAHDAFSVHHAAQDGALYTTVSFWANGGATGGQQLQ